MAASGRQKEWTRGHLAGLIAGMGESESATGGAAGSTTNGTPENIGGLNGAQLARGFHREVVAPLVAAGLPGLRHAAGRLGSGSDVLGLDDAMSRDHDWGCRLTLLVDEADRAALPKLGELLERGLPERYRGLPTRFPTTWAPSGSHQVEIATVGDFAASRLGVNPLIRLSAVDWLSLTGQSVLEVTAGPVFTDTTAELRSARDRLRWYPDDVERYVLAAGWQRLGQRLPFIGRAAETGQELQSRLLASASATDLMRLSFLLCRRWAPLSPRSKGCWRCSGAADCLPRPRASRHSGIGRTATSIRRSRRHCSPA